MGGYGEGTLFQRSSDGRWIGRLPDGRGGHRHATGTDRDDVARRLRDMRRSRDRTTSPSRRGGERVRDFLPRWLDDVAAVRLRPRTLEGHREIVANHLVPRLGRYRVRDLEPSDVQRMVRAMTAAGSAPQTVHNVVRVLSTALRHAEREGVAERNAARLADLPRRRREPLPSLATDQVRAFLEATRDHPLWPVWALAATTGMRQGEVLSLRWQDVDRVAWTVTVAGTYRYAGTDSRGRRVYAFDPPKTDRSRRTLHLPALARQAIEAQLAQATSAKLVFARRGGDGPLDATSVLRAFQAALVANGLPSVRFHALRHSAAVMMLDRLGGDIRAVSATLGHSTISTTVDVYGSNADDARRRAAAAMDDAMEGMG